MNIKRVEEFYNSPEYKKKLEARFNTLKDVSESEFARARMILEHWSVNPCEFIETFLFVKIPNYHNAIKPFFLFDYQKKIINKILECELDNDDHTILIDKPREMGVTYIILAYLYWRWLFHPDWTGFTLSRSEAEVDDGSGTPDSSLFGKLRWMISMTPKWLLPETFQPKGKKGTQTDMMLKLFNPTMRSSITGSTTNKSAGRSRRYSLTFVDEAFFIEHFEQVWRSLESVSRVKIFASSAKASRSLEKFKQMCEEKGDYIHLEWKDHPWKDQEWFEDLEEKAKFDPEIMREAVVSYAIDKASRYYPQIEEAKTAPLEYDPKRPLYISLDTGRSDLTVLVWWQYTGFGFNILECVSSKDKEIDWYAPFINKDLEYNPTRYLEVHKKILERIKQWHKPVYVFSGLDIKAKKMPTNKSTEQHLYPLIGTKITVNNYAEGYEARRVATAHILPLTTFNENSDFVMELFDAIANSQYSNAVRATSKKTAMSPVHGTDGTSDYRSAFEYGAVNITRVIRRQRTDERSKEVQDLSTSLRKYLRV